jgi:hypothetical protein
MSDDDKLSLVVEVRRLDTGETKSWHISEVALQDGLGRLDADVLEMTDYLEDLEPDVQAGMTLSDLGYRTVLEAWLEKRSAHRTITALDRKSVDVRVTWL